MSLPIYQQCLARLCLPRMQSNTADISAVFNSTSPIYWQCLTAHCRYIGGANVCDLLADNRHFESDDTAQYCTGVTIALIRIYTADLSAMRSAVPGCFFRLLRVLYEIYHTSLKSQKVSLASRPYVLFLIIDY